MRTSRQATSSRPRSVPARCGWCWITNMSIRRDGRRSFRSQLRSAARRRAAPQRGKKAEVDSGKRAGVPIDMAEKLKALERENPTSTGERDSSARRQRILPRRSSTAG